MKIIDIKYYILLLYNEYYDLQKQHHISNIFHIKNGWKMVKTFLIFISRLHV